MSEARVEALRQAGYREAPEIIRQWEGKFRILSTPGVVFALAGLTGSFVFPAATAGTLFLAGLALCFASAIWANVWSAGPKSPAAGREMESFKMIYGTGTMRRQHFTVYVCHDSKVFCQRLTQMGNA